MENNTGDFILGAGMVCREKEELVPSFDLPATGCVLGQATSPPLHPQPTSGSKVCRARIAPYYVKSALLNGPLFCLRPSGSRVIKAITY